MKSEQPPYDFIMNSGATPQKPGILPAGGNKTQRLIIAVGGGLVLLSIFAVIFALLLGGEDPNRAATLRMAQQHTETLRVADIGVQRARSPGTKNLAATAKLSLQSSLDKIVAIASKDQKIPSSQLNALKDSKTDEALTSAEQNNRFDEAFTETMYDHIRAYLKQLQVVYKTSDSKADRAVLDEVHAQLNQILPSSTN